MSINFHETTVAISVDLTANFTLTGISTDRTAADMDEATAQLDYPIHAYFCDDTSVETPPSPYSQGSTLQVCVEIDDSVEADVYVDDILRFVVSQPLGPGTESVNIDGGVADPLTLKICRQGDGGICNVKTQLPSKFFVNQFPNDLQIDGMALLAFGIPTPAARKLVRIRGTISAPVPELEEDQEVANQELARRLQEGGENPFSMQVGLVSDAAPAMQTPAAAPVQELAFDYTMAIVAVIVSILVIVLCCCCGICVYYFAFAKKKNKSNEEENLRQYACNFEKELARGGQLPPQFS
jgi:hypothetical protein